LSAPAAATSSDQNAEAGGVAKSNEDRGQRDVHGVAPSPPSLTALKQRFPHRLRRRPNRHRTVPLATARHSKSSPTRKDRRTSGFGYSKERRAGLIIGLGASAFWMRRRWVRIDRS